MADVDDDPSPAKSGLVKTEGEMYMESLVRVSLLLVTKEFPLLVQLHGSKMIQHLVDRRRGELSSADLLNLRIQLAQCPSETSVSVYPAANAGKLKEHNKRNTSLIVLAANNILRSLTAEKKEFGRNGDGSTVESNTSSSPIVLSSLKRAPVFQDERVGISLVLDPHFISSPTSSLSPPLPSKRLGQPPSLLEDERIHVSSESNNNTCTLSSENGSSSSPEKSDRSSPGSSSGLSKRSHNCNSSMSITDNDETIFHQRKEILLLTEHNLLCEAFSIPSFLGNVEYARMIPCLLDPLNKIWTLAEWKDNYVSSVSQIFSDGQFLEMSYHVVKFGEEQLKRSKTEGSGACDLFPVSHLQLILPLLLQLLQCIHALWNEEAYFLPEELERAKCLSGLELATMLESTNGLYDIDNEKYLHKNKKQALLEGIRQRVYSFVGLCTSIVGVFPELLASLSVMDAFLYDLRSMELRHLGKVIRLVVVPLVENCPYKFWKLWMVDFLGPLLTECEHRLYFAWFDLLYHGGTGKPYFYGDIVGSDRQIKELKQKLLLVFTREVSDLLRVLAVTEKDMESVSSSLLRFLLLHGSFKRIRMSLFGYFVDDETTMKAIPFCRSLTWLAISDMRVRHLIVNDLLPCLIRRLDNQLPCAIQRLRHKLGSSTRASASKDLEALCEEWYNYFEEGSAEQGKPHACAEKNFTAWLRKKKKDLQVKACSAAKELFEGSDWNWEFEDEFRRYLPAYMDMLQQVDSINYYEEFVSVKKEWLFQKLKPEFRSKYGMNSCAHPYMITIFSLWQTKRSINCAIVNRNQGKFVSELIKLKPFIKASDSSSAIVHRLKENPNILAELPDFAVLPSVNFLRGILFLWEPVFHPLIRESHMDLLLRIVDQYTLANESEHCQQVAPDTSHFDPHLQPYAEAYFETKLKEKKYHIAVEQIHLHKKFDGHLASGVLDGRMDVFRSSKDDFVKDLVQNEMARMQLSDLHHELIKLSLERRNELVKIQSQVIKYSECLRSLLKKELLKGQLRVLVNELEIEGFFDTENNSVDWENKLFSEHVDKFNNEVFAGHCLPKYFVIRGIIDYRSILMRKDSSQQAAFKQVVDGACDRWVASCKGFWMGTSYYEHLYYDIVRRPLEQVFATDTMSR